MSTTTDAMLSCGVQAPGRTCDDVGTLWSPVNLLPLGIAAVVAVMVMAVLVVALVRLGRLGAASEPVMSSRSASETIEG